MKTLFKKLLPLFMFIVCLPLTVAYGCGKKVTSVQLISSANTFNVGDVLENDDFSIVVTYDNKETETVKVTNDMLKEELPTLTNEGIFEIKVTYDNKEYTVSITVVNPKKVETISALDCKTAYETFDTFVANGHITVNYKDGTNATIEINNDMIAQTPDLTTAGTKTVVITYMNQTCEYQITVVERTQVSYEFKDVNLEYYNTATSENVNLAGGKMVIKYSNGTSKTIDLTNDYITQYPDFTVVGEGVIVLNINGNVFNLNVNISTDPEVLAYQKLIEAIRNVIDNGLIDNTTITGTIDINLDTRVLNDTKKIDKTITGQTSLQGITDGYLNAVTKSLIEAILEDSSNASIEDIVNVFGNANIDVDELKLIVNAIQKFISTNADFDFYTYIESNEQLKAIKDRVLIAITSMVNSKTFCFNMYDVNGDMDAKFMEFVEVFEENLYADIVKFRTFDGEKLLTAIKEFAVDYANETENLDPELIAQRKELCDAIVKILDNLLSREIDPNHALSLFLRSTIDYKLVGEVVYFDFLGAMYDDEDIIKTIFNAEIDIVEIFENVIAESMKEESNIKAVDVLKEIYIVLDEAITYASEKEVTLLAFETTIALLDKVIICMEDGRNIPFEVTNALFGLVQMVIANDYSYYVDLYNRSENEIIYLEEEYNSNINLLTSYEGYINEYNNLITQKEQEIEQAQIDGLDTAELENQLKELYWNLDYYYSLYQELSNYIFDIEYQLEGAVARRDFANQELMILSAQLNHAMALREVILDFVYNLSFGENIDYRMLIADILTAVELEEVLNNNFIESFTGIPQTEETKVYYENFEIVLDSLNTMFNDKIYGKVTQEDVIEAMNNALYNLSCEAFVIAENASEDFYLMFADFYQEIINVGNGVENASMTMAGKLFVNEIVENLKYLVVIEMSNYILSVNEYLDVETFENTLLQMIRDLQDYYLLETVAEAPVMDKYLWTLYDVLEVRYAIESTIMMTLNSINPEADMEVIYSIVTEFVGGLENQYRNGGDPVDYLIFARDLASYMGIDIVAYLINNYLEEGTPRIVEMVLQILYFQCYNRYNLPEDYVYEDIENVLLEALQTLSRTIDEYHLESDLTLEEKDEIILDSLLTAVDALYGVAIIHDDVELYVVSDILNTVVYGMLNGATVEEIVLMLEPVSIAIDTLTMLNVELTIDNYLDISNALYTIMGAAANGTITTKVIFTAIMNSKVLNSQVMMFICQNLQITDEEGIEKLNQLNNKIVTGLNTGNYNLQEIGEMYFDLAYTYGGENTSMYYAIGLATLVYMDIDKTLDYNAILQDKITPPVGIASIDYNILINRILTKEAIENAVVISGVNEVITYNDQDNTLDKQELSINITFDFDVTFIVFKGSVDFNLELDF